MLWGRVIRESVLCFVALALVACGGRTSSPNSLERDAASDSEAVVDSGTSEAEGGVADATVPKAEAGASFADAAPADGGMDANVPDGSSEGGSCSIRASDYDQSCTSDSDCAEVTEGDFCGQFPCICPNAAVSVTAKNAYSANLSKLLPASPVACSCPATLGARCNGGVCGPCLALCTDSNEVCTNLQTDPKNCGQCGLTCLTGEVCQEGSCGNAPSDQ
jgi:hypothetical protein